MIGAARRAARNARLELEVVARRAVRHARVAVRQLGASGRPLPGFLVIGVQRGGTSSFYDGLTQHPRLAAAITKEVHFFDFEYARGERWYRANFPRPPEGDAVWMTGEATPSYLYDPRVPGRVRALLPDVRILALLRDPVDRAWSHYQRERRLGREKLSFEEAVAREQARLESEGEDYAGTHHRLHSYLARGAYAVQLERWLAHVARDRMLVMRSEDFYRKPREVLHRAYAFLELPAFEPRELRHLQGGSGEPIDLRMRDRLRAHFEADQARLVDLLRSVPGWSG